MKLLLKFSDGAPRQNGGALTLVWRVARQFVRPTATTHQWKKRAFVQPRQVYL